MLAIIKQFLKMNIKKWAEYRMDFFIGITAIMMTNLISLVFFWIIFQHVTVINGWTFDQMLFLLGLFYLSFGIWHVFFQGPTPIG
jgi:ABC-2 type transport system permease protein